MTSWGAFVLYKGGYPNRKKKKKKNHVITVVFQ